MKKKADIPDGNYIYEEQQKLRQWYVWFVLVFSLVLTIGFTIKSFMSYIQGEPGASSFIVLGALLLFICLFFVISTAGSKLNVIATEDAIHFQWIPLNYRYNKVFWQNVQSIKLIKYNSFGYGMRISEKYGSIYNAFGGYAINIITRGGNQFLIGTANPDKFEEVLIKLKDIHYFEYVNELEDK